MNFGAVLKAFDAAVALRDVAKRLKGSPRPEDSVVDLARSQAAQGLAGHIEARLTNVVVAALKEAFDRDHARLELERAQLEEQRRRADEALRLEQRRQATDREIGRLRLIAATAMIGWLSTILMLGWRLPLVSTAGRVALAVSWVLLLGALGAAFNAMGRAGDRETPEAGPLWLLIAGLGVTAITLML